MDVKPAVATWKEAESAGLGVKSDINYLVVELSKTGFQFSAKNCVLSKQQTSFGVL